MLEKIGLPEKPSLRGNKWVVDASHCQQCSSQFSFINRKHHCRRCGGLFCSSCTQQRMVLRGQGDSPVRICEPCKKLEEAARFELRHRNKNKAGKGGSKLLSNQEEDILINQILSNEGKDSFSSARASTMDMRSSSLRTTSGASSSSNTGGGSNQEGENLKSFSLDHRKLTDTDTTATSPEELRQQAIEEKNKYKTLKAEKKSEEALKAFKKGKELERQADALELSLRKSRKRAALTSGKDDPGASGGRNKILLPKNEEKDDLANELKELGWSEMDLQDTKKQPATLSLEGELSKLLGEVSRKTDPEKKTHDPDKSQVIALKKKALELKRAGNLAEAKEELKKAKLLEKQIEEQELLGEDDESDEELSSLIRSIDDYKNDDLSVGYDHQHSTFDFDLTLGIGDDLGVSDDLEVEDDDMDDPEIAAALKSLGWTEETAHAEDISSQSATIDREALKNEILTLKREALYKKREGNTSEAMALLKKAKRLEMDLDSFNSQKSAMTQKGSGFGIVDVDEIKVTGPKIAAKSKLEIQKELLGLKKRALVLRREGKLAEAEAELEKGKVLEKQLEEMDIAPKAMQPSVSTKPVNAILVTDPGDEDDVTDQDMHDPTYLSLLNNLGWKDDKVMETSAEPAVTQAIYNFSTGVSRKSKGEIQSELLGLKRKSLALRRQGNVDEAEEVLKMAKVLEAQFADSETPHQKDVLAEAGSDIKENAITNSSSKDVKLALLSNSETNHREDSVANSTQTTDSQNYQSTLKDDILVHKRKALNLKREGKLAEAKEELRQAKLLEKQLEEKAEPPSHSSPDVVDSKVSPNGRKEESSDVAKKPLTGRDRFKMQQKSLGHKRQALKLRREGRTEEADAELELAKALEAQLEEFDAHDSSKPSEGDDVSVEDFLDPQLMSALKALGIPDVRSGSVQVPEPKNPVVGKIDISQEERVQLEEQIKAEKVKAVNFKRSGKQAEALGALRTAKQLEKKLNSLYS